MHPEMISCIEIEKLFGRRKALDCVSVHVPRGEFFALLGPNGAGKTTLLRILMSLMRATKGDVLINGRPVSRDDMALKRRIGYVPQRSNLDKALTVEETMRFSASLYGVPRAKAFVRINELIDMAQLRDHCSTVTERLSGGMKRKLMVIQALIHEPELMVLDEPTVGIDVGDRRALWDLLRSYHQKGNTICLTTHYIEEAEALAHQVCLLDQGRVVEDDNPSSLIRKLGIVTVEYYDQTTQYRHFEVRNDAEAFAAGLTGDYSMRATTLEDVFFARTKRRVA
jgi:ABC-2 type transport system ATP-binding protein